MERGITFDFKRERASFMNQMNKLYNPGLKDSLKIQARVVYALIIREVVTRYGRSNIGFLWLFLEPMMFTVGIIILRTVMIGNTKQQNVPLASFLLTGYLSYVLFRNITNQLSKGISSNIGLFYHANVRIIDVFLSRFILEFCALSGAFIFLTLTFIYLNIIEVPVNIMLGIMGWFFISCFSLGFGFVIAYLHAISKLFARVWSVLLLAFLPLSGVFFMVSWLPQKYQSWVLWIPLVNGIELLREGFLGSKIQATYSIYYLFNANLFILFWGLILLKKLPNYVESQ